MTTNEESGRVQSGLIDKNIAGDARLFTRKGLENVTVTPKNSHERIQRGQAYCAQLPGPRKGE